MEPIKVYRSINAADKLFGLEFVDLGALMVVFFLVGTFNREGLIGNGVVMVLAYLGLRALKRNKPEGYMLDLARYVLMNRFKAVREYADMPASEVLSA